MKMGLNAGSAKKFPDYFPKGCPPDDAEAREICVYRICKSNPINRSDFCSYYELGKNGDPIKKFGVSVFSDVQDVKTTIMLPNHKNKGEYIAVGLTKTECGVIKHTPSHGNPKSSHYTWWLYEGAEPEKYFEKWETNHE